MQLPAKEDDAAVPDSSQWIDPRKAKTPGESITAHTASREYDFPGVLAHVAEYRDQVMLFVEEHCTVEDDRIDILVALQEALANAALHGCKDDPAKTSRCTVSANKSDIVIRVRDPGPGFDLALADPENYQVTTFSHGRGICLMRSLMSEVTFAHRGSEIVLRKHIHHA